MPPTIAKGRPWFRAGLFLGMTLAGLALDGDTADTMRPQILVVPAMLRVEDLTGSPANASQAEDRYAGLNRHLSETFKVVLADPRNLWPSEALASNRVACLIADSSRIDVAKLREQWSDESVTRLVDWVHGGGGLVLLAGPRTEPAMNRLLTRFGIVINPVSGDGKTWTLNDTTPVVGGMVWRTSRLGRLDVMESGEGVSPIIIVNDKTILTRRGGQDPVGIVGVLQYLGRGRVVVISGEDWVADDSPGMTGTDLEENWRIVMRLISWAGSEAE